MKRTLLCIAVLTAFTTAAEARITRIAIDPVLSQSPTFGGYSWPGVGQYERLVGIAYGEVNPNDPKNSVIVDVGLAPRNARGNVEYSFDFYILKPIDLKKGAHKVMYEPPNRGNKTWNTFGRVLPGFEPTMACGAMSRSTQSTIGLSQSTVAWPTPPPQCAIPGTRYSLRKLSVSASL